MIALSDWRFRLRAAALAVLLAGLFMPPLELSRPVYDVLAVLDITGSMNVRDQRLDGADASRLAMEKRATHELLSSLPCGSRLGLAIFVEKQPFLLFEPVETCENYSALDQEISAIDWRMGWDSESHIAEGLLAAMKIAATTAADLIFMTDGQETPPLWWSGAAPNFGPVRDTVHGLVVGVGGRAFMPIPKFDGYGREIGFFKPGDVPAEKGGMFQGREHLSAVDEPHLRSLASAAGLTYVHLADANSLFEAFSQVAIPSATSVAVPLVWSFGTMSLFLQLCSFFLSDQKFFGSFFQKRTA